MVQPPGFVDPEHPDYVCKLQKSIYGLKKTPRAWYQKLVEVILSLGFHISHADTSLFVHQVGTQITISLVYLDDILLTSTSEAFCKSVISDLQQHFPIKDMGEVRYFLGLEVERNSHGMFLS